MRNVAEHEIGRLYKHEEVERVYKKFIGLGQEGILPKLTGINARLYKNDPAWQLLNKP